MRLRDLEKGQITLPEWLAKAEIEEIKHTMRPIEHRKLSRDAARELFEQGVPIFIHAIHAPGTRSKIRANCVITQDHVYTDLTWDYYFPPTTQAIFGNGGGDWLVEFYKVVPGAQDLD